VVSGLGCRQKENELMIPLAPPKPPVITRIDKLEMNCSMPFNVRFMAAIENILGNEIYEWTIGGTKYYSQSPTVQVSQTGILDVSLKVKNEIGEAILQEQYNYTSNTMPVIPAFNYGAVNNNYRVPAKIDFTDLSQRATSVRWDFGDGYQSNLRDPQHTYTTPGTYTITLTAMCDSDTASQSLQVTILSEPDFIRFERFEILQFPDDYFPEDDDDNTHGGDFYVDLLRDNFRYGYSDILENRSKTPVVWRCPEEWNGDYKLVFYALGNYAAELWDENDNANTNLLNAQFSGTYLKSNYYPTQLDFESDELRFRIRISYED
jgi:hypothetical protein